MCILQAKQDGFPNCSPIYVSDLVRVICPNTHTQKTLIQAFNSMELFFKGNNLETNEINKIVLN